MGCMSSALKDLPASPAAAVAAALKYHANLLPMSGTNRYRSDDSRAEWSGAGLSQNQHELNDPCFSPADVQHFDKSHTDMK